MKKITKQKSCKYLIGIDEVGRGPLAGPVAVGAFLIPVYRIREIARVFRGVKESKQLTEEKRNEWFAVIMNARAVGGIDFRVSFQSERIIDRRGLSYAIRTALRRSLIGLEYGGGKVSPRHSRVLLDGGLKAPAEYTDQTTIIKGDEKEMIIALASICAKVLRDRKMIRYAEKYPEYGFDIHKGYGTKAHRGAIRKHGPCLIHRKSFIGEC